MSTSTKPQVQRRPPGGPNGEVRDILAGFKVAPTERGLIHEVLRRRGYQPRDASIRDFLLALAEQDEQEQARTAA